MGTNLSKSSRTYFIKKVVGIVAAQLLLTAVFVLLGMTSVTYTEYIAKNPLVVFLALTTNIVTFCALSLSESLARKVPTNYILLAIFTVSEAILA